LVFELADQCSSHKNFNPISLHNKGAFCGSSGNASCGGIFRDHEAEFVYGFAEPLTASNAFIAEICGFMRAIEIAYQKSWNHLWIETDSLLVVSAFNHPGKPVAWSLRNRWKNAIFMASHMHIIVTHIYREGNQVADLLANYGLAIPSIILWDFAPLFIRDCIVRNKQGIPNFTLCLS
jgi:ribonuclease HI